MKNTLIATVWFDDSIKLAVKQLNISKLILLEDEKPKDQQQKMIQDLTNFYKNIVEIKIEKIPKYDILEIVKKCMNIIEEESKESIVYVDVTQGKRTQFLGILFATYKKFEKVKQIIYAKEVGEKEYELMYLPKLKFTHTDQKILQAMQEGKTKNQIFEGENKLVSKGTYYTKMNELEQQGFVEKKGTEYSLTESGKIMAME